MGLDRASGHSPARLIALVLAVALPCGPATAETLDTLAVQNGTLIGHAGGRAIGSRDLIGTSFSDGAFSYSIVDAASDPFLPGLWRYRVSWKAQGARDWSPMCRNSRGSTGWAYAVSSAVGPRFICEDADVSRCLAGNGGLTAQSAISDCLGG